MSNFRFILITSGLIFLGLLPFYTADASKEEEESGSISTYEMLDLFGEVFEKVREDYVEEVEDQELVESAINGMLTALDPHSGYLNAKSFSEMKVQTKGEFGGLGIEVTMKNGLVKVVSPIDDTPAYEAGVQAGDLISHIDTEPVMGLTLSEAVEKLRGKVGSTVSITVLREGETEPIDIDITRAVIKIKSVRSHREGDIAYIRITSFSEQAYSGLEAAFNALRKEIGPENIKGVVLDLRNNPGGLLDQAIDVSDAFLEQGEIVSTRGRTEDSFRRYNARPGDITDKLPVVVIVNAGSASASEIVAGALQDHKRAVVLGTQTFGKGSVQTVIPLGEHGAMRLTTSRYYTPSGRSIQLEGIAPDIIVEPAEVNPITGRKISKEADLRNSLENTDRLLEKADEKFGKNSQTEEDGEAESEEEESKKDYQLQRALDLIRGISIYGKVAQTG